MHRASARTRGFELVELTVTLVIVSILIGIGYSGSTAITRNINNSAAQTLLSFYSFEQTAFYNSNGYYATTSEQLSGLPAVEQTTRPEEQAVVGGVSMGAGRDGLVTPAVAIATVSKSGDCITTVLTSSGDITNSQIPEGEYLVCSAQLALDALGYGEDEPMTSDTLEVPRDFAVEQTTEGVALTWATQTGVSYTVTRTCLGGSGASAAACGYSVTPTTSGAYIDINIEVGSTYIYELLAVGDNGDTRSVGPVSVTVNDAAMLPTI